MREFQFEWDDLKAASNFRKHGISFELASSIFYDPQILTVPDLRHSETEERWNAIGCAANGALVTVVYLWTAKGPSINKIRLISARRSTKVEIGYYQEGI